MPRKLNDMQLILLATACQREDGSLLPPPSTLGDQGARIRKSVAALIKRGLAAEADVGDAAQAWREEGDRYIGVVITAVGRAVIAQEEQEGETAPTEDDETALVEADASIEGEVGAVEEPEKPEELEQPEEPAPPPELRADTKKARVLALLHREESANLDELVLETDWLPHTTRAALTGLRKKGHAVLTEKVDGKTRYRIAGLA